MEAASAALSMGEEDRYALICVRLIPIYMQIRQERSFFRGSLGLWTKGGEIPESPEIGELRAGGSGVPWVGRQIRPPVPP